MGRTPAVPDQCQRVRAFRAGCLVDHSKPDRQSPKARTEDIESAFARLKTEQADALYVVIDELLNANRLLIVRSAEAAKLPIVAAHIGEAT